MSLPAVVQEAPRDLGAMLDVLPLTERVFFDLQDSIPLVESLLAAVDGHCPAGRTLLPTTNETLIRGLVQRGHEVEAWRLPGTVVSRELRDRLTRSGTLQELLAETPAHRYDAIVAAYLLEAADGHPLELLARLRGWLAPGGRLVVAWRRWAALGHRYRALRGHAVLADPFVEQQRVTLSWPNLPVVRLFTDGQLSTYAERAGLDVLQLTLSADRRAFVPCQAMSLLAWSRALGVHGAKRLFPGLRDCGVAVLRPQGEEVAP